MSLKTMINYEKQNSINYSFNLINNIIIRVPLINNKWDPSFKRMLLNESISQTLLIVTSLPTSLLYLILFIKLFIFSLCRLSVLEKQKARDSEDCQECTVIIININ